MHIVLQVHSVTGTSGVGSAEGAMRGPGNNRGTLLTPRIVAAGNFQVTDLNSVFTIMLPRSFKQGIDSYVVNVMAENPQPVDGGTDFTSANYFIHVTKLDDRWTFNGSNWIFDADAEAGGMKGFVIHLSDGAGGGEGSRDTQLMWSISTVGFDLTEFAS